MSGLLKGKKGLIMGVANDRSIAWGIAEAAAREGATLAFTYQNDVMRKRVEPLATSLGAANILVECDVVNDDALAETFAQIKAQWGELDFVVHAVAFSDKEELKGQYLNTSLENFLHTMHVSCYSFTAVARHAAPLMRQGGSLLTLSYIGANRVIPNYNVMGVAKAALEASVRYLAADLGEQNIRVHALSAGPMKTLAGSAIGDARYTFKTAEKMTAMHRSVDMAELGDAASYLLSDYARGTTGDVHYIDAGFKAMGMVPTRRADEV